jgi:XTP/dITP diphosphohydrolase
MRTLFLATTAAHPLAEVQTMLRKLPFTLLSPRDIQLDMDVEETGMTCAENALCKVHAYAQAANRPTRAAACGLESVSLGGAPGMYSACFAERLRMAFASMQDEAISRRPARFRCVRALTKSAGYIRVVEEVIEAYARGEHGFGYDPIFFVAEYGRPTTARRSPKKKQRISHRGRAAEAACRLLENWPVH